MQHQTNAKREKEEMPSNLEEGGTAIQEEGAKNTEGTKEQEKDASSDVKGEEEPVFKWWHVDHSTDFLKIEQYVGVEQSIAHINQVFQQQASVLQPLSRFSSLALLSFFPAHHFLLFSSFCQAGLFCVHFSTISSHVHSLRGSRDPSMAYLDLARGV